MAGTLGRVYGGDPRYIHVPDGKRKQAGMDAARSIHRIIWQSQQRGLADVDKDTCPGCYMVVGFNALVDLAIMNGQSLKELGLTMAAAFTKLAECEGDTDVCIEEIQIILDPPEVCPIPPSDG